MIHMTKKFSAKIIFINSSRMVTDLSIKNKFFQEKPKSA